MVPHGCRRVGEIFGPSQVDAVASVEGDGKVRFGAAELWRCGRREEEEDYGGRDKERWSLVSLFVR